jgi:hypothetical protein
MIVKNGLRAGLVAVLGVALSAPVAEAQSVSDVEGARMKERQGRHLNRMDREQLRRYGGNDDYGYRYRGDAYGPYDGPGVSVYVGPRPYYRPYGY